MVSVGGEASINNLVRVEKRQEATILTVISLAVLHLCRDGSNVLNDCPLIEGVTLFSNFVVQNIHEYQQRSHLVGRTIITVRRVESNLSN